MIAACRILAESSFLYQVECKKAQPKEVMLPTLTRSARTRTFPYLDAGGASYLVTGR